MAQVDMKKFIDEIAAYYSRERIEERSEVKTEEWKIAVRHINKRQKILDLCCGPGTFLVPLTKGGYDIEGTDSSEEMLKHAREYAKNERVKIRAFLGDATNVERKNNSYDVILLMGDSIGSIPGSENRQRVLNECHRLLKDNGVLIVTMGNRHSSLWWLLKITLQYLWRRVRAERIEFGDWIYELYGKKGGIHHNYSRKEAIASLQKAGLKIEETVKVSHKFIFVAMK